MAEKTLWKLGVEASVKSIRERRVSAYGLAEACLERIADRDAAVRAWAHLEPDRVLEEARRLDLETARGPLHGVPFGVKDIIDTAHLRTERGSQFFAGRQADEDAEGVGRLRKAGAVVLGKTVTTEFAYFAPGPTANPHRPDHTPGGSSSGSAAAVADFQVPFALGTQTAGSVIRPASFNGIIGFKPSFGSFPLTGVLPLAPSLDTLGLFTRGVEDLWPIARALTDGVRFEQQARRSGPRVALLRTPYWSRGEEAMQRGLEAFAGRLEAAGSPLIELDAAPFEGLAELQNGLLASEAQETLGPLVALDPMKTRPETRDLLAMGAELPDDFPAALRAARKKAEDFLAYEVFPKADVILTPSAPGEAPQGLDATGDPLFNRIWTLLGLPCLNLPIGRGPRGLPLGAQLVGARDRDEALLAAASVLEKSADFAVVPPSA